MCRQLNRFDIYSLNPKRSSLAKFPYCTLNTFQSGYLVMCHSAVEDLSFKTMDMTSVLLFLLWFKQVGLTPVGWNLGWNDGAVCAFVLVIDFNYRVYFNYFGFILTPLVIMALIYAYIFTVVKAQLKEIASLQVFQHLVLLVEF